MVMYHGLARRLLLRLPFLDAAAAERRYVGWAGMLAHRRALLASASMSIALRILVLTAGWLIPLGWTIVWGVFRGAYAHGGFGWWQHAHHAGLALFGAFAFWVHWRNGGPFQSRELLTVGFVATGLLSIVGWFAFRVGLAGHDPPSSITGFLFDEP
jgi:hypothetical protein